MSDRLSHVFRGGVHHERHPGRRHEPPAVHVGQRCPDGAGDEEAGRRRAVIAAAGREVRIFSPSGADWTARFPSIVRAVAACRLDRVLIAAEIRGGEGEHAHCVPRDLLAAEGRNWVLRPRPERKARLRAMLGSVGRRGPIEWPEDRAPCAEEKGSEPNGAVLRRAIGGRQPALRAGWEQLRRRHPS